MEIESRDIKDLCRFCLDVGSMSIDDSITALDGRTVASFLGSSLCPRKVNLSDSYPTNICAKCLEKATSFYNFIKLSHKSLKVLQKRLEKPGLETYISDTDTASVDKTSSVRISGKSSCSNTGIPPSLRKTEMRLEEKGIEETNGDWSDGRLAVSQDRIGSEEDIDGEEEEAASAASDLIMPEYHCQKSFQELKDLARHQTRMKHTRNEDLELYKECQYCRQFIHVEELQRHKLVAHDVVTAIAPKIFLCNVCGRVLKSSETLIRHEKMHKGILDFSCEECGAKFATKPGLKHHMRQHFGPLKRHPCNLCEKAFRNKTSLSRHQLWHAGTKAYTCETCCSHFYTPFELKSHISRVHKPTFHDCVYCDRSFKSAVSLRAHIMVHKNVRPFQCKICEKSFVLRVKFVAHLKARHNIEVRKGQTIWKDPKTYFSLEELLGM